MNTENQPPRLLGSLASGFLAGIVGGELFMAVGLARHGADLFGAAPNTGFALFVVARSVAVYGLLGGAMGVLIAAATHAVTRLLGRGTHLVGAVTLGFMLAATVLAYLSVWWQLEVLAGLPMEDADRLNGGIRHALVALGAGLLWVLVAASVHRLRRVRHGAPYRRALGAGVVCILLLLVAHLGLRTRGPASGGEAYRPSRVVVVGLDALTFRIMGPMLRAGELPTFQRLLAEGAWGSYLTYGQASSPMVWTSMATGKRVRDHGIHDFVTMRPGRYGAEPMKSFDWKARPVWSILNDFGRRVGIIDWLVTFPPPEVDGYVVTRLHMDEANRAHPPELNAEIEALLEHVEDYGDEDRTYNFSRIDHVFETTHLLLDRDWLDFVALFEGVSDWVEHRYWKYYEPEHFDPELWDVTPEEVEALGSLIPETYAHLDQRLGELMARLDEDALVIVVSDHGQRPAAGRPVWMRLDRVLEALGLATLTTGADGKQVVDHQQSRAYTALETPWAPVIGVNVNLEGREPEGIVPPAGASALQEQIVEALSAVRFENGTPVFGAVYATGGQGTSTAGKSDIVVTHSRFTRSDRYSQETIEVGGRSYRLEDFMESDTKISGGHDHQGVIFLHGKGVRPGPIGQLAVSTAIQEMIWHLTDKIELVDRLMPFMRRLGLIERATTLDLTPTILHAFGLPVGRDMSGRALAEVLHTGQDVETIASYETGANGLIRAVESESDDDMLERLKALGYIN